jgi:hypothetical protein
MEGRMLLKKARSTLDLVATGTRSQKEVFKLLDKMRKEDERWRVLCDTRFIAARYYPENDEVKVRVTYETRLD